METLSSELKSVIGRRLEQARPREILAIASALCGDEVTVANKQPDNALVRFDVREAIVRDNSTGLIWTRGNVGTGRMKWEEAGKACAALDLCGSRDWRLPTIKELLTLVDYERHDPAIDADAFKCESAWYWSSTPLHSSPGDCAWFVCFGDGLADWSFHVCDGFVRAVRVGQF